MEHNEEFYRIARKIYEADGRNIIDATIGGKCNIFTKADYTDVMYNRGPPRALQVNDVTHATIPKSKGRRKLDDEKMPVVEDMDTQKFPGSQWMALEREELGR
eukprot:SAG31_NODE_11005_length_1074_cov_1.395897_1_plen_103_part_00